MLHKTIVEETITIDETTCPQTIATLQNHQNAFTISLHSKSNINAIKAIPTHNDKLGDITITESLDTAMLEAIPEAVLDNVVLIYPLPISALDYARMTDYLQARQKIVNDKTELPTCSESPCLKRKYAFITPEIIISPASPPPKILKRTQNTALLFVPRRVRTSATARKISQIRKCNPRKI